MLLDYSTISYVFVDATTVVSHSTMFNEMLDRLGKESAEAQFLNTAITSTEKLKSGDSTAIVAVNNGAPIGFIKYGTRKLYLYQKSGEIVERSAAPCLLDFYVSTDFQRNGLGHSLFIRAVEAMGVDGPHRIAYDRPSLKLVAFLSRHCGLQNGDLQPNRFMIFDGFL